MQPRAHTHCLRGEAPSLHNTVGANLAVDPSKTHAQAGTKNALTVCEAQLRQRRPPRRRLPQPAAAAQPVVTQREPPKAGEPPQAARQRKQLVAADIKVGQGGERPQAAAERRQRVARGVEGAQVCEL